MFKKKKKKKSCTFIVQSNYQRDLLDPYPQLLKICHNSFILLNRHHVSSTLVVFAYFQAYLLLYSYTINVTHFWTYILTHQISINIWIWSTLRLLIVHHRIYKHAWIFFIDVLVLQKEPKMLAIRYLEMLKKVKKNPVSRSRSASKILSTLVYPSCLPKYLLNLIKIWGSFFEKSYWQTDNCWWKLKLHGRCNKNGIHPHFVYCWWNNSECVQHVYNGC